MEPRIQYAKTKDGLRGASVRAISDCGCVVLTRCDFLGVVRNHVEVALSILPVLSRRLCECQEQPLP